MIGNYIKGDRVHYRNQFGQEFYATVVHVGRGNVLLVLRDDMERCETNTINGDTPCNLTLKSLTV